MNESGYFSTASGSFHTTSRSRAWSESTERPDSSHSNAFAGNSPRSVSQEIEHIKKLISGAESNRQYASGSITAVVFRNRTKEPVAREHIFHELDALKKRIKLEQFQAAEKAKEQEHVLARRASQIDPGQESESEVESVLDEREEELESAHEALRVQRDRFESLLESAEERVDLLTGRNEGLLLEQKHLEAELKQENERSQNVLHSAEERLDRLTEEKEIAKARTNHLVEERDLLRRELENLAAETGKLEAQVVREKERIKGELGDTKAQLTRATKERSALENELQATRKWVEELNAKIEDGAKALQIKSKAFDDLRVEKGSTDVAHRSAQEEILRLHALKTGAETALKESNAKVGRLEQENQDAANQRELLKSEQEQQIKSYERTVRELHSKHETAAKDAVELGRKHKDSEKALSELKSTHKEELERVQAEEATRVKELEGQHSYEQAELQAAHVDELARVRDEAAAKLAISEKQRTADVEKLKYAHVVAIGDLQGMHADALSELKGGHSSELEQLRSEHAEKLESLNAEAREAARVAAERHASELETVCIAHKEQLNAKSDEVRDVNLRLLAKSEHAAAIESELSELRQSANASASEFERNVAELSRGLTLSESTMQDAEQAHISALTELRTAHERELGDLRKSHTNHLSELEESHEAKSRDHGEQIATDLVKLQEDHAAEVQLLQKQFEEASAELASAKSQHNKAINTLREEHDTAIAAQGHTHDELLQDVHTTHRGELISLRSTVAQSHADKISSARDHDEALRKLRAEHEAAIERTTLEHAKVHERLAAEHEQELRKLQTKHNDDIISIRSQVQNSTSESAAAAAVYEGAVTKLRTEHADEVARLHTQHDAELQTAKQSAQDMKVRLAEDIAQHEKVVANKANEIDALRSEHNMSISKLKTEHEAQLSSLRSLGNKSDHERERDHQADLANARGLAKAEVDKLRNEHSIALAAAEFAQRESAYQMQASHDQQIKILAEQHQKRLDDLRVTTTQRQAKREDDFARSKKTAAQELERMRQEHARALEAARSEGGSMLEARMAEAAAKTDALTFQHDRALSVAQHELDSLRREHEEALASLKHTLEGELGVTRTMHKKSIAELQATLQSHLGEAKVSRSKVIAEHDSAWVAKMHELKEEHAKSLAELMSNSDTTTASSLKELERLHADATAMATESARREANDRAAIAESQHKIALEAAVQKARSSSHAEVRNLKKRHQGAVSHIRETAQKNSAAQLSDLERTHRQDIERALERARHAAEVERKELMAAHQAALDENRSHASQAHQVEIVRLTTEHQAKFANIEARLQMDNSTKDSSRQAAHDAELEALQARLDATMSGQAEAERALASLRKQVVNADKRVSEAKAESEDQIAALMHEKNDLTSQLVQVQTSLRELQRKTSGGSGTPRASSSIAVREEVAGLHTQVTMLEEERSTMRLLLHKRQEEKNEVSRQNDFLVKELEMLLQQRSRSSDVSRSSTDANVQIESALVEPKADVATFAPIKAARRNTNGSRPVTPLSPGLRQAREDVEMAWRSRSFEDYLDNARAELFELGSVISANEALFARKIDEHVGELQRAKDELAADYNAKVDALAKDKDTMEKLITSEQHAQFAKDRKKLVAKFGSGSDAIAAEHSAMLTSLPVDTAVALRTAEQKLVDDYNQRITKRKSQIALKHAEEFQMITQDYDRSVKVLLNTRSRLEGDLSIDPSKFEDEYGDIAHRSAQLVAERRSNIGAPRSAERKSVSPHDIPRHVDSLPDHDVPPMPMAPPEALEDDRTRPRLRSRTSNPRNERSIPRSTSRPREFFPGSRDSPEATSQPLEARPGSSSKHPPVPQHSLMRTKEAADFFAGPTRVVTEPPPEMNAPRTPRGRPKSRATDSGIFPTPPLEPEGFGSLQAAFADMRVVSLQAKSPSILRRIRDKISLDGPSRLGREASSSGVSSRPGSRLGGFSRPGSSLGRPPSSSGPTPEKAPSAAWRPGHPRRSKSRHLSSGMIYYKDPARIPPMPGPYNP